jgi:hypothetical protein
MYRETLRGDSRSPMSQVGDAPRVGNAPDEEGRQPQMSQPMNRPGATDDEPARGLVPDTRDDIVVSRAQE